MTNTAIASDLTPPFVLLYTERNWPYSRVRKLHRHQYSAVFPAQSDRWLKKTGKHYRTVDQEVPIVIANRQIVFGYDHLQACKGNRTTVDLLDFDTKTENELKALASFFNYHAYMGPKKNQVIAVELLLTQSTGSLSRAEANVICGLEPNSVIVVEVPESFRQRRRESNYSLDGSY